MEVYMNSSPIGGGVNQLEFETEESSSFDREKAITNAAIKQVGKPSSYSAHRPFISMSGKEFDFSIGTVGNNFVIKSSNNSGYNGTLLNLYATKELITNDNIDNYKYYVPLHDHAFSGSSEPCYIRFYGKPDTEGDECIHITIGNETQTDSEEYKFLPEENYLMISIQCGISGGGDTSSYKGSVFITRYMVHFTIRRSDGRVYPVFIKDYESVNDNVSSYKPTISYSSGSGTTLSTLPYFKIVRNKSPYVYTLLKLHSVSIYR